MTKLPDATRGLDRFANVEPMLVGGAPLVYERGERPQALL